MKFLNYIKFLMLSLTLLPNQINAVLTPQEERAIIEETSISQDVKDELDPWFADNSIIRALFINEKIKLHPTEATNMAKRLNPAEGASLISHSRQYWEKLSSVCNDYSLKLNLGSSFILTLPNLPNYVIRINRQRWPLKTQNISRVFYAKKINDYIEAKGFSKIIPLKAFLYHIPGMPDELNDDNYLVIQENIFSKLNNPTLTSLPPKEFNLHILHELKNNPTLEFEDLKTQIVHVTGTCGLWDFDNGENMIFIPQADGIHVMFLDTEGPGFPQYGGVSEGGFFHKIPAEVDSNTRSGFNALHKLITS